MRRLSLLPLLLAVLSACGSGPDPVVAPVYDHPPADLTPAGFDAALAAAPTSAPLGAAPSVSWTHPWFRADDARPVSLEWPPRHVVGDVRGSRVTVRLPAAPDATLQPVLDAMHELILSYGRDYATCQDSLAADPPDVNVLNLALQVPTTRTGATAAEGPVLRARLSPAPPNVSLTPFARSRSSTQLLVYATARTTVRGELRCMSNLPSTTSGEHLRVNAVLEPGWNGLTLQYVEEGVSGIPTAARLLLRADAGGVTVAP